MDESQGISVEELIRALKIKGVPLPHEVGTFLALQVCEALMERPREIDGSQIYVDAQGRVTVATGPRATELAAARGVVTLLGEVLVASAPGVPEVLLTLLDLEPLSQRSKPLCALRDELEAALVPLNRGATMRIVGRLAKDAFGISRARDVQSRRTSDRALTSAIDDLLGIDTEAADAFVDRVSTPPPSEDVPALATTANLATDARVTKALGDMERTAERSGVGFKLAILLVLGLIVAAVAAMLTKNAGSGTGEHARHSKPSLAPTARHVQHSNKAQAVRAPVMGRLLLDSTPQGAQVLMAVPDVDVPLIVEGGVAHEFVVIFASGRSLRRVVPADAAFAGTSVEQPLTIAMDALPDVAAASEELGPSLLQAEMLGTADGQQGALRLRVPADATVYKLVGITPTEITPLPTTEGAKFLLYHGGYAQTTVVVERGQWQSAATDGGVATLSLRETLQPHS